MAFFVFALENASSRENDCCQRLNERQHFFPIRSVRLSRHSSLSSSHDRSFDFFQKYSAQRKQYVEGVWQGLHASPESGRHFQVCRSFPFSIEKSLSKSFVCVRAMTKPYALASSIAEGIREAAPSLCSQISNPCPRSEEHIIYACEYENHKFIKSVLAAGEPSSSCISAAPAAATILRSSIQQIHVNPTFCLDENAKLINWRARALMTMEWGAWMWKAMHCGRVVTA